MATNTAATVGVRQVKPPRNPISRKQVETIISRSVASFGVVFGLQTIPAMLGQLEQSQEWWRSTVIPIVFISLSVAFVASIVRRGVKVSANAVSVIYLIALLTWPIAVKDDALTTQGNHWLYFLLTVATASAAIGMPTLIAVIYLFVTPTIYGLIRLTPAGGGAVWQQSVLDSIYAIILGGAVVIIVTMLRDAASAVDSAQATALDRYAHAVRQHATEVERVQVDSIVHDSVLTTFISAARAFTPEAKVLASTMAGNAIGHLREAALVGPDDASTIRIGSVARRVSDAASTMSEPFEVRLRGIGQLSMPVQAAEAVYSASVQAMVNSLQHAGGGLSVRRWLSIRGISSNGVVGGGIQVEIGDTGSGFDLNVIPTERIGLRVSIIERVANAGGGVEVDSASGEGTVITIRWPNPQPEPAEIFPEHEEQIS